MDRRSRPYAMGLPSTSLRWLVATLFVTALAVQHSSCDEEPAPADVTDAPQPSIATPLAEEKTRGFVFTAPKRLLAETNETVCLSLHNIPGSGFLHIDVLHAESDEKIASLQHRVKPDKSACMEIYIPKTSETKGRIHLKAQFDDLHNYTINSVKEIYIEQNPYVLFIETDKPVYKPGQEVKFRILTVKNNLSPVRGPIWKIWLENPAGVRMAQWLNVSTELGLAQLQYQLSPEPVQGNWVIKVQRNKNFSANAQYFEVKEYVLPKYEVIIKPPRFVLSNAKEITWTVCAKYSYGKPVKGEAKVEVKGVVPYWRLRDSNLTKVYMKLDLNKNDGCSNFTILGEALGFEKRPDSIVVNATVEELGTGIVQSSVDKIQVHNQAVKVKFLPYSMKHFKPGLPYKGKVRVVRPDETPVPDEEIQLCLRVNEKSSYSKKLVECKTFLSNSDGFVEFVVAPQRKNISLLTIRATAVKHEVHLYQNPGFRWMGSAPQPEDSLDVDSWYSPSDSYIEVADWDDKVLECNTRHRVSIYFTVDANVSSIQFTYLVKSRGDIIQHGHKIHQPNARHLRELNEFPNVIGRTQSPNDSSYTTKKLMDKFSLKLHISPKMSPVSNLLVYYVRDDGETVAASHVMKIEKCFANEVKAEWSDSTLYPGSESKFKVVASPKSLCAITAVDKSVTFLGKQNKIDEETVFKNLEQYRIDESSPPRQADDWEYCEKKIKKEPNTEEISIKDKKTPGMKEDDTVEDTELRRMRKKRSLIVGHHSTYVDAISAFDDAGLLVISDAKLHTRPCVDPIHHRCNPCPFQFYHPLQRTSIPYKSGRKGAMRSKFRTLARGDISYRNHGGHHHKRGRSRKLGIAGSPGMPIYLAMPVAGILESVSYNVLETSVVEVRSFFPETWLWDLVHTGEDGIAEVTNDVPHTITEWAGHATCISPQNGLGTSSPAYLNAFQPFFIEVNMPYSVKRGEVLRLKVSIFNFLSYSLPIKVNLKNSPGIDKLDSDSIVHCIEDKGSFVAEFRVNMTELGEVNITVIAEVDELFPEPCGPDTLISKRDVVIKPIIVKPEGFPMEITESSFVCASEAEDVILYWNLELPSDVVEGSARAEVSAIGDMLGPTLENLDGLIQLPMGCGEQNMILFVPNIHVMNYLESTNQVNPKLKSNAIKNMEKGYQRELSYRHEDGSYSAFGKSDKEGSMWLTAFVVKSFAQARKYIFIDKEDLKISMRWITKRQLENGCFPFVGKVFHKDIKGGLSGESSSAAFSAYVLTALLETGIEMSDFVLLNALYCIAPDDQESSQPPDMYTLALTTYAFSLAGPNHTETAQKSLSMLLEMASRDKDLLWWNKPGAESKGMNIEITAYAILSLVKLGGEDNLINAFQAVRWISQQRNSYGGFVSTQDTVVALEALSKYATVFMSSMDGKKTNLSVHVKAVDFDHTFSINDENRLVLNYKDLSMLPTGVDVTASGEGCALVQSTLKYNVKTAKGSDAFDIEVTASPSKDGCIIQKMEVCTRYKLADDNSNMAVMEIDMVSGFVPIKETLDKLKTDPSLKLKRWEESKNQINLYFDELTTTRTCVRFLVEQASKVEKRKPASIKIYDYYQQELAVSTDYNFPADCEQEILPKPLPAQVKPAESTFGDVVIVDTPAQMNAEEPKPTPSEVEGTTEVDP